MNSLVKATLASPLVIIALLPVVMFIYKGSYDPIEMIKSLPVSYLIGVLITAIYGLPIHLMFEKAGITSIYMYLLAGAGFPFMLLAFITLVFYGPAFSVPLFVAVFGGAISVVFWVIAVRMRN